jgi:hypothetical protein
MTVTAADDAASPWCTLDNAWRVSALLFLMCLLKFMNDRQARVKRAAALQIHAAKKFKVRDQRLDCSGRACARCADRTELWSDSVSLSGCSAVHRSAI